MKKDCDPNMTFILDNITTMIKGAKGETFEANNEMWCDADKFHMCLR